MRREFCREIVAVVATLVTCLNNLRHYSSHPAVADSTANFLTEYMDYSGRVNSKKGSGGVAGTAETNVHVKRRIRELLATNVLDLDSDPYVFRSHLGSLECRLCLTVHKNEALYISHLGGRKHQRNLEARRVLDEKRLNLNTLSERAALVVSINNTPKRSWDSTGQPAFTITKVRDPETLRLGLSMKFAYPKAVTEPIFRIMSYYELSSRAQKQCRQYMERKTGMETEITDKECARSQYLVVSAEPYENVCLVIPNTREIDFPPQRLSTNHAMSPSYWWFWDQDSKDFFLQFLYKDEAT